MAQQPQGLSRTLPKSFTFPSSYYHNTPRTPEHARVEPEIPPPPRHSSYRIRRPRFGSEANIFSAMNNSAPSIFDFTRPDVPLPSIEFPPSETVSEPDFPPPDSVTSDLLQVPALRRTEFKTPPAQIRTTPYNFPQPTPERSDNLQEDPIERPSSRASDSSVSSIETYVTQPSLGGSCTSPESDIYDPFGFQPEETRKYLLETPSSRATKRGQSLDTPKKNRSRWTTEMDNHLWNVYQIYLQDPTITPFKMLPGTLPPLGVSHRVAREAKKTWPRLKSQKEQTPQTSETAGPSADKDGLAAESRSGSNTPTGSKSTGLQLRWPRSEATTRRRLKILCRRKFSIAPHYQRLLASRSPSPFLDPFTTAREQRPQMGPASNESAAFTTRDLGVSLVSSSLPSAFTQPPFASPPSAEPTQAENWFNNPESQPFQQQPQPQPSITISAAPTPAPAHPAAVEPFPRLGSPFMYNTWGPDTSNRELRTPARKVRRDTVHVAGSRLRSPPRMDLGSNIHKRRVYHRIESSPNSTDIQRNVRDLARDGKLKDGQRRVRLRNRGNTTSGGFSSKERIEQLFSPTSPFTFPARSENEQTQTASSTSEDAFLRPRSETIRRLGSPFSLKNKPRFQHPGTPRHAPSLSDSFTPPSSTNTLGYHFSEVSPVKDKTPSGKLPYDPTEEGISDAERIRRQILNLPFTKN
ncbi:hypothetical protein PISL3812_07757 [Talaromyces islandicus]|uniref:Uncharacterized protein n=1 Tax=Talaromyces islandicus TaxID=28573 RepID=A0A0U1M5S4_TALIS|nr:hypothetical protein PISL3812_07757 [Talaromyces islandicus]